ncbi:hypothetical protein HPB51_010414 [Rhipicephalus microplus]|uniref:Uncharacterized protein n=1 Tax=Rhipicephalus microplus TaxID=6941 RepID=A0A9J6E8P2_RHIMP|nr:hypothetical protein HPB51_010414 [Rhipicephalus microplus]
MRRRCVLTTSETIVAADAVTPACLSELLTVKELSGVPVTAREPVDRRSSIGFVHGTGGDLVDSELTAGITSAVPFFSASKEGRAVKAAVREEYREVRSYAAVFRANNTENPHKDPGFLRSGGRNTDPLFHRLELGDSQQQVTLGNHHFLHFLLDLTLPTLSVNLFFICFYTWVYFQAHATS